MKRGKRVALVVAALSLWTVALAEAQPPSGIVRPTTEPATPSLQLGAELYAGNCASCHGIAGSGITSPRPGAADIAGQGPSLRGVGAQAADFYLRMGFMPLSDPHREPLQDRVLFTDKEIRSLITYVASLGSGPAIPQVNLKEGSIQDGLKLFTQHCAGCHQIVGRGGFATGARIPPLQGITPTEIAEAVRTGPYLMPKYNTSQISAKQLDSLVHYVISTKDPDNHGGWGIGNLGPIPEGMVVWWIGIPLIIIACMLVGKRLSS